MTKQNLIDTFEYWLRRPFVPSEFKTLPFMGTTIDSHYVPLLSINTGELVVHENKRVVIYETLMPSYFKSRVRNYGKTLGVYHDYVFNMEPMGFCLLEEDYSGHMGSLFEMHPETPLFVLTIRREHFWKFLKKPSLEGLTLVVSRAFLESKKYTTLRAKLKPYFTFLQEQDIPTLIVSDIAKFCFNTPINLPKFKTIGEKLSYLSDLHNFIYKPQAKPKETNDAKKARLSKEAQSIAVPTTVTESSSPYSFA